MGTAEYEGERFPEEPSYFVLRDFVLRELAMIGAEDTYSPLFARFITELVEVCLPAEIAAETHFANHPEDQLRTIATDLLGRSDLLEYRPEQEPLPLSLQGLSTSEGEELQEHQLQEARYLGNLALRTCNSYKMALLVRLIQQLHAEIKQAQRAGDHTQIIELMAEISRLNTEKRRLSDLLGERTIIG